jgi:phage-related protein
VTIAGSLVPSSRGSRGAALDNLAYFLDQSARPVLYYQVDDDQAERVIGLRAVGLSAPYSNPTTSAFTLGFKAPDPLSYSVAQSSVTGIAPGASATITPGGNFRAWPSYRIHGPCTNPVINVTTAPTGKFAMLFTSLTAGQYIDADMSGHTVIKSDGSNLYNLIDQTQTTWPSLAAAANTVSFAPATSSSGASLDVTWRDSWL